MSNPTWFKPKDYHLPSDFALPSYITDPATATALRPTESQKDYIRRVLRVRVASAITAAYGADSFEDETRKRQDRAAHPVQSVRDSLRTGDRKRYELRRRYHQIVQWSKTVANTATGHLYLTMMGWAVAENSIMEDVGDVLEGDWWTPDGRAAPALPEEHASELGTTTADHVRHVEAELARRIVGNHHDHAYHAAGYQELTSTQRSRLAVLKRRGDLLAAGTGRPENPHDLHDLDLWGYDGKLKRLEFGTRPVGIDPYTQLVTTFDPETLTYAAEVANGHRDMALRVIPNDPAATVDLVVFAADGTDTRYPYPAGGNYRFLVGMVQATTRIEVRVKPEIGDPAYARTYTINVTQAPASTPDSGDGDGG